MVTLNPVLPTSRIFTFPSRQEWRAMLDRPAVAITAIVCGFLLAVSFIAAVTFLAYTGRGVDALTGAGAIGFLVAISGIWQKLKAVERHVTPTSDGGSDGR